MIFDEISKLGHYEFYEKYLIQLKPRQFLSFIFMLVIDINRSRLKNTNEGVKLVEHMAEDDSLKIRFTTNGELILVSPSFGSINCVQKRIDYLTAIHNVNNEINITTEIMIFTNPTKTNKKDYKGITISIH